MSSMIDRNFMQDILANLVRINSVNPSLVPGSPGEAAIADYVAGVLMNLGLSVRKHEPEPGRVSVVGCLPGVGSGRSLMFNAHVDTVGVDEMSDPFSADIRDGKLYGRGAFDMKGSLAAQIAAVKALRDHHIELEGDLLIAAVADEEYASLGTANLVEHYQPDGAIVTEPTSLQLCLAHKGFMWLQVETHGRAAHGSRFEVGIDANMRMGRFLCELDKFEQSLRRRPGHPLVGPPSLHAATLHGGSELSMYAATCRLGIERRTVPGESAGRVVEELQQIIRRLADADDTFVATLQTLLTREPFEAASDSEIVPVVHDAAKDVMGNAPEHIGDTPWMDSALLAAAGVDTVVIGPHGDGAHAAEEWVSLDSVADLAAILVGSARQYCGERT